MDGDHSIETDFCTIREHVGIEKLLQKIGLNQPLMPDPELGQDVAFLAHVITENQKELTHANLQLSAAQKLQKITEDQAVKELEARDRLIRANEEAKEARKARCVEKCQHPADFVCDYEDGTSHCLECVAEKLWQIEDILSGKHNVHTYWGALETIAHPERYLTKYDPVEVTKGALAEKRKCEKHVFNTIESNPKNCLKCGERVD